MPPALGQINIVVRDMAASIAFYRLLGLTIDEVPLAEWAPHHASSARRRVLGSALRDRRRP